jgi:cytochrome d ubiquinol oxidase subunit II
VHLYDIPLVFALVGLVLYVVLAGADFGAGLWQLGGRGRGSRIRDFAHHALGPVWEANHVWLIFVLTVMWTAYPSAFGSIASTLSVPLFVAALGIVARGAAYALRAGVSGRRELRAVSTASGVSSIVTPFALGAAVGGIASGRVPVGNAAGDLVTSWLNPTSVTVGLLAVAVSAYMAAVFLAADATRLGRDELQRAFRLRALAAGVVAGGVALGGLLVLREDAPELYAGLVRGDGLAALIASGLAGVATLALVYRRRFETARYTAGVAVAAVVAGWALAQAPRLLPGLTVHQAAASHDTLVAVVVAVIAGGLILAPSLALLFGLVLGGRFDEDEADLPAAPASRGPRRPAGPRPGLRVAGALLLAGVGLLTVADAGWAHAIGVVCLLAFVVVGAGALLAPLYRSSSST